MSFLLAIDGGSQSTKVSVIDEVGQVHAMGRSALRSYELGPNGRAVHPDDDLWDSLTRAAHECLTGFAGAGADIAAIGLCGIRSCRAYVGQDGHLTEPVLSWMDPRVDQPLGEVPPDVALVTSAGGYLAVRLTGEFRDSSASYAGMWPIDIDTSDWSRDPAEFERTRMPGGLLPELVAPGEVLGLLSGAAAESLGLPSGCPVVATGNDKAVEALGSGLLDQGEVLLSLGTYVAAMTVADRIPDDPWVWRNSAAIPGRFLAESAGVRRGMSTVSWASDLTGDPVEDLEAAARLVPPGSNGLMTIPDWLAPGDAPYRRGAILGFTGLMGRGHLYRSVAEGLVVTMAGHIVAMESALGVGPCPVILSGGGAGSPLMRQITADVLDRPVRTRENPDGAGLGAAICAALGAGLHPTLHDAAGAMVRPGPEQEPEPESVTRYAQVAAAYRVAREFTDPLFAELNGA